MISPFSFSVAQNPPHLGSVHGEHSNTRAKSTHAGQGRYTGHPANSASIHEAYRDPYNWIRLIQHHPTAAAITERSRCLSPITRTVQLRLRGRDNISGSTSPVVLQRYRVEAIYVPMRKGCSGGDATLSVNCNGERMCAPNLSGASALVNMDIIGGQTGSGQEGSYICSSCWKLLQKLLSLRSILPIPGPEKGASNVQNIWFPF